MSSCFVCLVFKLFLLTLVQVDVQVWELVATFETYNQYKLVWSETLTPREGDVLGESIAVSTRSHGGRVISTHGRGQIHHTNWWGQIHHTNWWGQIHHTNWCGQIHHTSWWGQIHHTNWWA